jgi:hypothetical protein
MRLASRLVITREAITAAYHRLLEDLGSDKEKTAIMRDHPEDLPAEADLMRRAVETVLQDPARDVTDLLAALQLAGQDQSLAEGREANVVALLRGRGVSWRAIAQYRGLESPQAARQRYERLTNRSPYEPVVDGRYVPATMTVTGELIFAFRIADEPGATWFGDPDLLDGGYETTRFPFVPDVPRPPFSGRTLEVRHGHVQAEVLPGYLRAYPMIGNRRIAMTAATQTALFGA